MNKEVAGNLTEIFIGNTKINGIDNATLNRLAEILDVTAFGDTHRRRIGGIKDSNISLSGNYLIDDAGQMDLIPGEIVTVKYYPQGAGQPGGKQIDMIVENFQESADVGGKVTFSSSLSGTSPVTKIV
ncbi:Predicted secreted protein [Alkalithermobacter thermoalcaliphilus JW-YL-7 = DSM 7308]|uniref:Predicted secreted protein n=1 Tax=Alkalithermobacter thermoalcaliphilus JW-YL-7 = DSM 7308 TaxID=1121328 RepID=A0A150FPB7_CLOPD|nr:hypothetical protein JWYL7_0559 [[Clostridium] paradoxum JW-YL-7 = DSM 7308]SHK49987.1 Predicted secreted protein [[Clostridium] paradoxum JW-YL-7 = DSM 7308]